MLHSAIQKAYAILEKQPVDDRLFFELAELKGPDVLDLISLAHKVRVAYAREDHICTIMNAKSGVCPENCRYCAQSAHHETQIDSYPLVSIDRILEEARKTYESGVTRFGIVTSGLGYPQMNREFETILSAIRKIHETIPNLHVCASLGILGNETAKALAEVGICHYNHNIQVNPEKYDSLIATTHSVEERIQTIRYLKEYGVEVCSGGILGLGENMDDRVRLALVLRELDVDVIPLNVLIPIPGTALEGQRPVSVVEVAKTFAIFRLIHPEKPIKFAAGRETIMKDFQGLLMLSGASGYLTGGYLTTRGRGIREDKIFQQFLEDFSNG